MDHSSGAVYVMGVDSSQPTSKRVAKADRLFRSPLDDQERERFYDHLAVYLSAMYPGCRSRWRRKLIENARHRGYYGRLGEIAGALVTNSLRHQRTDYDRLLRINGDGEGLSREEARSIVTREVEDMAEEWRQGSAESDPGYIEIRETYRRKWRKLGRKKPRPGVIAAENAAMAVYLQSWLERQTSGHREAKEEGSLHAADLVLLAT